LAYFKRFDARVMARAVRMQAEENMATEITAAKVNDFKARNVRRRRKRRPIAKDKEVKE
jgi:hypothetical protein